MVMFDDGGQQSIMFDSNRNGGIYAQNGGRWVIYHDYANNCLVGAVSSSYELYVVATSTLQVTSLLIRMPV